MEIDLRAILRTFLVESEEHLRDMEEASMSLEAEPENKENLRTIFRAAHTLKGNASTVGLGAIAELAHGLEDLLESLMAHRVAVDAGLVTLLLRTVDTLREMVGGAAAGRDIPHVWYGELLQELAAKAASPLIGDKDEPTGYGSTERRKEEPGRRQSDHQRWDGQARTLRVDIEKLDRLLDLTGEIAISRGRLRQMLEKGGERTGSILEAHREADALFTDLQELVMKLRMVPTGPGFRQYIRTVRDLAAEHGKMARLIIEGAEVEVDTKVIEHLRDPLTHMIRNAIDHGIERPEVRQAQGKDPCGRITLRAYHQAGGIVIQLSDDGVGLDRERILERARDLGRVSDSDEITEQELHRLVLESGFSTAATVTELSGRGLGMDIVRRNVEMLRGSLTLDSAQGRGTTISIRLPLTLANIEGFGVGVGEETYVIPMDSVVECLEMPDRSHCADGGGGVINLRGEALPYLRLRSLFDLEGDRPARENVVVVQYNGLRAGLAVDVLYGAGPTVIKPLGKLFRKLEGVSGSAILGSGRVALILDVPSLLQGVARGQMRRMGERSTEDSDHLVSVDG